MRHSRRISNCLKRKTPSDLSHMIRMTDPMTIIVETLKIDIRCSLKEEFVELIRRNPLIVLCQIVDQVDSCHGCVGGPLT